MAREQAALQLLLAERPRVLELIKEELGALKAKFATPRRTRLGDDVKDFTDAELIEEQHAVIITTADGFVKRLPLDELSAQASSPSPEPQPQPSPSPQPSPQPPP